MFSSMQIALATALQDHPHPVLGSEVDQGPQRNGVTWNKTHPPALCQCGDDQNPFQPCEGLADAATRTAAEWEIGKCRAPCTAFRIPPSRIELTRVRIKTRITVHHVGTHQKQTASRHRVSANGKRVECLAGNCIER